MASKKEKFEFDITVGADGKARVTCSQDISYITNCGVDGWTYTVGMGSDDGIRSETKILYVGTGNARLNSTLGWSVLPPHHVIADMVKQVRSAKGLPPIATHVPLVDRLKAERDAAVAAYERAVAFETKRASFEIDSSLNSDACMQCGLRNNVSAIHGKMTFVDGTSVTGSFCVNCLNGAKMTFDRPCACAMHAK